MRLEQLIDDLRNDLRFAWRMFAKGRGLSISIILTLMFGIGANIAIFSIVDAAILRPLPYSEPGRVMWITKVFPQGNSEGVLGRNFLDWQANNQSFESLTAFIAGDSFNLTRWGRPQRIRVARVSSTFLQSLGVSLSEGRFFTAKEDEPGGNPVVIVSRSLWEERFGSQSFFPDSALELNGKGYSVIGVLPRDFSFPEHPDTAALIPIALDPVQERGQEQNSGVAVIGRLRPGVTITQSVAALRDILERAAMSPSEASALPKVIPLQEHLVGKTRPALLLLLLCVGALLLICCVNIAILLLYKSAARSREFGIRTALGAEHTRLARQLLAESTFVGLLGGALGLPTGFAAARFLMHFVPVGPLRFLFQQIHIKFDLRIGLFALALSILTGIAFGWVPALLATRVNLLDSLKQAWLSEMVTLGRHRVRHLLVIGEVCLSLILLTGAGLLLKSLYRLVEVDPGFQPQNVLSFRLQLSPLQYADYPQRAAFFNELARRLKALPGVTAAGFSDSLPLSGNSTVLFFVRAEGQLPSPPGTVQPVNMIYASPGYFQTIGTHLIRGREFSAQDAPDSMPVAIVSASMAEHFWGTRDVLGRRLRRGPRGTWQTVIGVVDDVRHDGLDTNIGMTLYFPFLTSSLDDPVNVAIRAQVEPGSLLVGVRRVVASLDADLPIYDTATLEEKLASSTSPRQFSSLLLAVFAALALLLSTIGVYGTNSFSVVQRTHEIGIRIAFGAQPRGVLKLVMIEGMSAVVIGVVIGLPIALALTRFLRTMLFEVQAGDATVFAGSALLLIAVATCACYMPARRALRIDPIKILRDE